jgi:hypothetical protein
MVVFSSELLAYYDLTFIILVSTGQARGIQAVFIFSLVAASVRLHGTSPWHLSSLVQTTDHLFDMLRPPFYDLLTCLPLNVFS